MGFPTRRASKQASKPALCALSCTFCFLCLVAAKVYPPNDSYYLVVFREQAIGIERRAFRYGKKALGIGTLMYFSMTYVNFRLSSCLD